MSSDSPRFDLLDPNDRREDRSDRRRDLDRREIPESISSHREGAKHYQADPDLVDAVNVALALGAPLLLTGEPGTGKTQVAHYLAWYFHLDGEGDDQRLFPLYVRSTTTAEDLLYSFDAVAYLHAASDPRKKDQEISKGDDEFIQKGPLWLAFKAGGTSIVLIDEIDKASRDFPNDLLNVLDQHEFTVAEKSLKDPDRVIRRGAEPPLVIITSNSERRLPEPFLRRCVFHHIELTNELVDKAVAARAGDFPHLSDEVREAAVLRFWELRSREIRKRPATAELLAWLAVLSAQGGVDVEKIRDVALGELPALGVLVKDRDDQQQL